MIKCKIHATLCHRKNEKEPKCTLKAVICGFLIASSMLSTAIATPVNTFAYTSDTSIVETSEFEISQFRKLTRQGVLDGELLKGLYNQLSALQNKTVNDDFINMIADASIALDHLDVGNIAIVNGDLAQVKSQYDKAMSLKDSLVTKISFKDVPPEAWYSQNVQRAASKGIINGVGDNLFNPQGELTVAEAIKLTAATRAYYDDEADSISSKTESQGSHWVSQYADYIKTKGISNKDFSNIYDEAITRGLMAELFARTLPDTEYAKLNDISLAVEQTTNTDVVRLFESGVLIGDNSGFRLQDTITRAETAALINRLIDTNSRKTVDSSTFSTSQQSPSDNSNGGTQTDIGKIPPNPKTWYVTPSWHGNNQRISANSRDGFNQINTLYNHTYNCANQQEYDAVINAVTQAYNTVVTPNGDFNTNRKLSLSEKIAIQGFEEKCKKLREGSYTRDYLDREMISGVVDAFPNDVEKQIGVLKAGLIHGLISDYVFNNLTSESDEAVLDGKGTSAYDSFFSRGVTCEGDTARRMAIWDVMGYNCAAYGSDKANHMADAVELYGVWLIPFKGCTKSIDKVKEKYPDLVLDIYATNSPKLEGVWLKKM